MVDRRDFDYWGLKKITDRDVDPIRSQFRLSINTVLNLIKQHTQEEIDKILCKNFDSFQKYGEGFSNLKRSATYNTFNKIKKRLGKMGYMADDKLTKKGEFSSKIYADEILTGEMFATDFYRKLNEFQILMIIACLCYESRKRTEFYKVYRSAFIDDLKKELRYNHYLQKEKRFNELETLTALIHPCYHGKNIFEIIRNTNLLEGDVIRFFRQVLDRIGQIKNATDDYVLRRLLDNCKSIINDSMKDIEIL